MKNLLKIALLFGVGLVSAAAEPNDGNLVVHASVRFSVGEPPFRTVSLAEAIASEMFATARVKMIWRSTTGHEPRAKTIIVDILPGSPHWRNQSAFAYARPHGDPYITVFWARIEGIPSPSLRAALLAHILVHEITHVLEASSRHSSSGVMKAYWTADDIYEMGRKPLTFGPEDLNQIHSSR